MIPKMTKEQELAGKLQNQFICEDRTEAYVQYVIQNDTTEERSLYTVIATDYEGDAYIFWEVDQDFEFYEEDDNYKIDEYDDISNQYDIFDDYSHVVYRQGCLYTFQKIINAAVECMLHDPSESKDFRPVCTMPAEFDYYLNRLVKTGMCKDLPETAQYINEETAYYLGQDFEILKTSIELGIPTEDIFAADDPYLCPLED